MLKNGWLFDWWRGFNVEITTVQNAIGASLGIFFKEIMLESCHHNFNTPRKNGPNNYVVQGPVNEV